MWDGLTRIGVVGLVVLSATIAGANTNTPAGHAAMLAAADSCLGQLQQAYEDLGAREVAARASNQVSRANCLRVKQAKVRGLISVATEGREVLAELVEQGETRLAEAELAQLRLAVDRGLKLIEEAEHCRPTAVRSGSPPRPLTRNDLNSQSLPLPPPQATRRLPRGELHCLRQEPYACLLLEALQRDLPAAATCPERLVGVGVAPVAGWQPERCVTLDDLVVTVAHALGLTGPDEGNPQRCLTALRVWGLPVDDLLPVRTAAGGSVLLREDEVRHFFARGLAGPPRAQDPAGH
ncbi:hypothetical protein HQ590_01755 [bacterium]|nr:hypothetical protein [bacterium]